MSRRRLLVATSGVAMTVGLSAVGQDYASGSAARRWYVSPAGDRGNAGTRDSPWTLDYALSGADARVRAGDRIRCLPGRYAYQDGLACDVGGTRDRPVVIETDAGVTWDFGLAEIRDRPRNAWAPVEINGVRMYRSTRAYPKKAFNQVTANLRLGPDRWYVLAPHRSLDYLSAGSAVYHPARPYYVGPGVVHHTDGHIYFRGDPLPRAVLLGHGALRLPSTDPRELDIRVSIGQAHGVTFNAPHVAITGAGEIVGCWSLLNGNGQDGLTFDGPRFHVQGLVGRFGGCRGVTFRNTYANGGLRPDTWIDYRSIKGGRMAADGARTCGLDLEGASNVLLDHTCEWEHFFDGILGAADGVVMRGVWRCWDDAYQMPYSARNITIGGDPARITRFEGAGPSRDGGGAQARNPGHRNIYFSFAVVDPSRYPIFWGRQGADDGPVRAGVKHPLTLPTHNAPTGSEHAWTWKVYYVTLVVPGDTWSAYVDLTVLGVMTRKFESEHHVKNNIIHVKGAAGPFFNGLGRDVVADSGFEHYDGNVYSNWPAGRDQFVRIHTSAGLVPPVQTLDQLRGSRAYRDSLAYSRGWETNGRMVRDVMLNERYVPMNPAVQTGAVDLTATGWPGTSVYKARPGAL